MHFAVAPAFAVLVYLSAENCWLLWIRIMTSSSSPLNLRSDLKLNCHFSIRSLPRMVIRLCLSKIILINCCHQIKLNTTFTFHQHTQTSVADDFINQNKYAHDFHVNFTSRWHFFSLSFFLHFMFTYSFIYMSSREM